MGGFFICVHLCSSVVTNHKSRLSPGASTLTFASVSFSTRAAQASGSWPKTWVTNAANSNWYDNPARVRRGRVAEAYALGRTVPPPEGKDFIHLLDGGIADNLGIAEPFRLLSTSEVSPDFFNQISFCEILFQKLTKLHTWVIR